MVVDVGVVKNYIKPKAYLTLYNMRKADLIEHIRCLEHNYNVAVSFNENQAKYIESLGVTERLVTCRMCSFCDPENFHCDHPMGTTLPVPRKPNDFCSYGERRNNE